MNGEYLRHLHRQAVKELGDYEYSKCQETLQKMAVVLEPPVRGAELSLSWLSDMRRASDELAAAKVILEEQHRYEVELANAE